MSFSQLQVIAVGGSGGLGAPICARLRREGAVVTVLDRTAPAAESDGFLRHDLALPEGIEAAAAEVAARRWDIVINVAGIQHFGPMERQSAGHLMASYLVNLVAPVRLTQAALPRMKAAGRGHIVNVGSIFGSINFAHFATYSSAKAGLRGFSQALRRELAGSGIDVTYVAPRAVRTPLNGPEVMAVAKLAGMTMDEPLEIAGRIVAAIRARKREAYFGFPEAVLAPINAVFPDLVDRALLGADRRTAAFFAGPIGKCP
ncbi:MAG TPA: SDR family NAD(P)-dependent oxidoreductase [Caulobacteraceae bacterium]|nr:SDR family NAD(P)-dependent oxidoreductase [Caulobacteraceae bacterium]